MYNRRFIASYLRSPNTGKPQYRAASFGAAAELVRWFAPLRISSFLWGEPEQETRRHHAFAAFCTPASSWSKSDRDR
jgi:hypothetical protein